MRCNACWRELEGQAIFTTCGHILCIQISRVRLSFLQYTHTHTLNLELEELVHEVSFTALKGTEDAGKILSNDAACPICDQLLSKRSVASDIMVWEANKCLCVCVEIICCML